MLNVKFPQNFENAIRDTEIVLQNIEKANYTKQAKIIEAETKILIAQMQAAKLIEKSIAESEAERMKLIAQANATELLIQTQYEAMSQAKTTLSFTATAGSSIPNKLLTFLWIFVIFIFIF